MKRLFTTICLLCTALAAAAQVYVPPADSTKEVAPNAAEIISQRLQALSDSLSSMHARYADWHYAEADTLSNPYYFYLFSSPTFYGSPMRQRLTGLGYTPTAKSRREGHSIYDGSMGTKPRLEMTGDALSYIYTRRPWLVRHMDSETPHSPEDGNVQEVRPPVKLIEKVERKPEAKEIIPAELPDIDVRRPNFWTFKADVAFQLIQNYVSDNWYKGGESNNSMLANAVLQANYDNKRKLTWNNKLEMKLGFQSSHSDQQHKYKTNTDLLRLTNELGIKASRHWYYSVMLQTWTQFCRGYKKNDARVYSDFLSPLESLLTLGMKYTLETKNKKFKLNVNLSPLAGDFKYVHRLGLSTNNGLAAAHHTKWEYGSNITATHTWNVMKNVQWSGRFYYYTNYKKAQIEWENTIDLTINKYLTTTVFLYPRFDDSVKRAREDQSYFQFKEYLSLGIKMSF